MHDNDEIEYEIGPEIERFPIAKYSRMCGVYFIKCEEFVKIGRSRDIKLRFRTVNTSAPYHIELLAVLQCSLSESIAAESELHQLFCNLHHKGEWFHLQPPLTDYIKTLKAGGAQ